MTIYLIKFDRLDYDKIVSSFENGSSNELFSEFNLNCNISDKDFEYINNLTGSSIYSIVDKMDNLKLEFRKKYDEIICKIIECKHNNALDIGVLCLDKSIIDEKLKYMIDYFYNIIRARASDGAWERISDYYEGRVEL